MNLSGKKNLLVVTSTFPKNRQDIITARFVFDLSRSLCKFYNVYVLTPHSQGSLPYEETGSLKIYRFKYFLPSGLELLSSGEGILSGLKRNPLAALQIPFFLISQLTAMNALIKRHRIDIVNSHWLIPQGFISALLKKRLGFCHLLTVHAADIFMLKRKGRLGSSLCRFILRRSDMTLPVSGYIRKQVKEVSGQEFANHIIPMGVYVDIFKPSPDSESLRKNLGLPNRFTFLFVGKFSEKKGVEYLLKAAAILKRKGFNFSIVLVGGGPLFLKMKDMAEGLGVMDECRFFGWLANESLPGLYSASDVLVVPSVFDRRGEAEGMPVVIQEAMACGVPVLASSISGIPDIVRDGYNGWLCRPAEEQSLAAKMEEIISLKDIRAFIDNALKTAEDNSYERISERYYEAIGEAEAFAKRNKAGSGIRLSLHNKINIEIESRHSFYISHFKKEYPEIFYQDTGRGSPDIRVFIDTDFPDVSEGDIYVKEVFKNVCPYSCLLRGLKENVTEVYFNTPYLGRVLYPNMVAVFFQAEILEPLIYFKALQKDMLMVHASGVFDRNGGYLFAAEKSTGKTTIAFHLVSKGLGFLGDDLVFLSKDARLYAYPKRVHFFSYLKGKNPFLKVPKGIIFLSNIRVMRRGILRIITGKEFYFSTRLNIKDIMPNAEIGDSLSLKRFFLLMSARHNNRYNSDQDRYSYIIDSCDTRRSLLGNILNKRRDLTDFVKDKETDIIGSISRSFKLEDIMIEDIVSASGKILQLINNGR